MRRIGNRGAARKGRISALKAVLALAFLGTAAVATAGSEGGDIPTLPYSTYVPDERLTFAGKLVRPEIEERRDAMVAREVERIRSTQKYQPRPAIWKIGDSDTTVYIFGTIHSLPPGFRWRNPVLEGVIVRADRLLLESTDNEADDVTFLEGLPTGPAGALPPLAERVSPAYRPKLRELQAILPEETVKALDTMPSWIAAMGIGFLRDLLIGDMSGPGADDWLERHFRSVGKPVEAIENSKAVITDINAIPEPAQRMMLDVALAAPDRTHEELDAPAHAWAQGDVGPRSLLLITPESLDPSRAMADPLLARRNAQWVDTLLRQTFARPGVVLFAAGAGHFVGPGSVIDLLQKRGVRVERVQ